MAMALTQTPTRSRHMAARFHQTNGTQVQFVLIGERQSFVCVYTGRKRLPITFKDESQALAEGNGT